MKRMSVAICLAVLSFSVSSLAGDGAVVSRSGAIKQVEELQTALSRLKAQKGLPASASNDIDSIGAKLKSMRAQLQEAPASSQQLCGNHLCSAAQYCWTSTGGIHRPGGELAHEESCRALPPECQSKPTCACLHRDTSGCTDRDGQVTTFMNAP